MNLKHTSGVLEFGSLPILMGILNVTPDSFSDGGQHNTPEAAVGRALEMLDEGARIIDIGGESTRPGSDPVSPAAEADRVLPVIEKLLAADAEILISIDTSKASVAQQAIRAGAVMINDVSGGLWDPEMFATVYETKAAYICMHALDRPDKMQHNPEYQNVEEEITGFLLERKSELLQLGVEEACLAFDVGIGFGKTLAHNLELIRAGAAGRFDVLERPMLWGLSRKSFIDKQLGRAVADRLAGGLAAHAALLRHAGPQIWRVHDVKETADYLAMHQCLR